MRTLPVLLILAAACSAEDRRTAPSAISHPSPPPALAAATQHDLATELDDADARGTWAEVKRRWTGQVLRWTVTRQRALCQTEAACNVAAFPVTTQHHALHGWMPELKFAPGQFAAVDAACGTAASCQLQVEGVLSKFELSPEEPTNLTLSNVRVITTTAQR